MILSLPGVKFAAGVPADKPLPFVFDGGQGVVSGTNEDKPKR